MNRKTYIVIKGYSALNFSERAEVREQIEKFEKEDYDKRDTIVKALSESVGPLDQDSCPCCGK